jgi:hypothetical protein
MAKKRGKAKSGGNSRVPRKEPYNARRMKVVVDRVREQAARLSGLVRAMEDAKLDIVVDGHAMLLRGLNQIDNFADNSTRALREAKTASEDL